MARQQNYSVKSVSSITESLRERMAKDARKLGATQAGIEVDGRIVEAWDIDRRLGAVSYFEGRDGQ